MTNMLKANALRVLHRYVPPALFDMLLRTTGRSVTRGMTYQAMTTKFDAVPMHSGRFGEIYERYWSLNPHWDYNVMRYRLYNICMAGWLCRNVPGDFICIGVDYGVAPRMVYDFVGLDQLGKTLHLVDPFTAVWDAKTPGKYANYNTAPDYVVAQYPAGASIKLHTGLAPDVLPLPGVKQVAFAFLDVSDAEAESSSLPILFDQLSPGGAIIVDRYGTGGGTFTSSILSSLGSA